MLISRVGHNRLLVHTAFTAVYLLLIAGSVIIIYPFILVITSSATTLEYDRFYPLPVFLWDDSVLLGKYLHEKYEGPSSSIANMAAKYGVPINSTTDLKKAMLDGDLLRDVYPGMDPNNPRWLSAAKQRVRDWQEFKKALPIELCGVYFCNESPVSRSKAKVHFISFLRDKYAREIERRYKGRIHEFNTERGFKLKSFRDLEKKAEVIADEISRTYLIFLPRLAGLSVPVEELERYDWAPDDSPRMNDWLDYKKSLQPESIQTLCLSKIYQDFLAQKYSVETFNSLYDRRVSSFREVLFRLERLASSGEISDWAEFLKGAQDLSTVRLALNPVVQIIYERSLERKFETIGKYNAEFSTQKKAFFEVGLSARLPADANEAAIWVYFIREYAPPYLVVPIPDSEYHSETLQRIQIADLKRHYLSVEELNRQRNTHFTDFQGAYDRSAAAQLLIRKLVEQYGSLEEYNRSNRSTWKNWQDIVLPNPLRQAWQKFLSDKYGEIVLLNAAHRKEYTSFRDAPFPSLLPDHDLVEFVKTALPVRLVAVADTQDNRLLWHNHLRASFDGSIERLSESLGEPYVAFEQVPFYFALPLNKKMRPFWIQFVQKVLPFESIRLFDPEENFRDYLREKYGTIEKLNEAYSTSYPSFESIRPPYREVDLLEFHEKKAALRIGFLFKNFIAVVEQITLRNRSLLNTAILCALSVLGALIVNPLAAYALSRFRFLSSRWLQFFLLAASAFPVSLIMIPNFLLLKSLGLLNTYWSIVLPALANGLAILILKSFFDRVPSELYDAACLDGAGEFRTFAHVYFPLCKPILAVVALQAFLVAYGRFLWPLLTCQTERMQPLTVWLYQFHSQHAAAHPELAMAALAVTSIPLVLVFLLCQRSIDKAINLTVYR
jgi:ABC-type glycerol-3-phosphate transport system permease component